MSDLQKAIVGNTQSLTQLLLQAKVIAATLKLEDVEHWVDLELGGYPSDVEPPKYREYHTHSLQQNNPYQGGWQFAGHVNIKVQARQPISEIEHFSSSELVGFPVPENIPLEDGFGGRYPFDFPQRFTVAGTQFKRVIDAVRFELLKITTELQKRGIKGENMSFDEKEKQTAGHMTFNIGTVQGGVGHISHSPITVHAQTALYDYSSVHQLLVERQIPKAQRRELEDIMDGLKTASAETKPSLMARAESWIIEHKELLGTGIELLRKTLG